MKHIYIEEDSRPIKVWTTDIEDEALTQARNFARLPFIAGNGVALMPIAMLAEAARWARLSPNTAIIPASRLNHLLQILKTSIFLESPQGLLLPLLCSYCRLPRWRWRCYSLRCEIHGQGLPRWLYPHSDRQARPAHDGLFYLMPIGSNQIMFMPLL